MRYNSSRARARARLRSRTPSLYGESVRSGRDAQGAETDKDDAYDAPWVWANAGGEFGLSGDWREALLVPGKEEGNVNGTLRGESCMSEDKQEQVRLILGRRKKTPTSERVSTAVYVCYCVEVEVEVGSEIEGMREREKRCKSVMPLSLRPTDRPTMAAEHDDGPTVG